jgi:hypothetical protein
MRSALASCRRRKLVCAVGGGVAFGSIAAVRVFASASIIRVNSKKLFQKLKFWNSLNSHRHLWRNLWSFFNSGGGGKLELP